MAKINYAIEITTNATAVTSADYGITAGVFRWITGRPSYDGTPTYPTGEAGIATATLQAHWYEGWIAEDGLQSPNRSIDISTSGTYGSMSGFKFRLIDSKASTRLWKFMRDNNIYLVNRIITVYAILDDVFYYAWSGVIVNDPHNEINHIFECKDSFRKIHKPIPPTLVTKTNFEEAEDQAKEIPVVVGDVSYSELTPETTEVVWKSLIKWNNIDGKAAPASAIGVEQTEVGFINYPYIDLWTYPNNTAPEHPNVIFTANELGDGTHYLRIAKATDDEGSDIEGIDKEYMIRIKGNKATVANDTTDGFKGQFNKTRIYLTESIYPTVQSMAGYNFANNMTTSYQNNIGIPENIWYFNIIKMSVKYYISESAVNEIKTNAGTGFPSIYLYNNDTETYEDYSYLVSGYDLSPADGKPYILLNRDSMTIEGNTKVLSYYKPDKVEAYKNANAPADITTKMTDRDRTTYETYSMTANPYNLFSGDRLNLDITLPQELLNVTCDRLWLCPDISKSGSGFIFYQINPYPVHFGIFVKEAVSEDSTKRYPLIADLGTTHLAMFVPQEYYDMGGNSTGYVSVFQDYQIGESDGYERVVQSVELDSTIIDAIKDGTYVPRIRLRLTQGGTGSQTLRQIVFVAERTINLTSEPLYIRVNGETVDGGVTNNVYAAFRLMLENYDGIAFADIDYGNLSTYRSTWHCGRALDKRKSSFDYLKELCEQSFVCLFPTRSGQRKLTAWRDDTTSVATHTQASIIRGSLGDYEQSAIEKLYNAFHIRYAYDPGKSKFVRSYYVDGIDADSFPVAGSDWSSYVGGINADSYEDAKALWDVCHASYVRAQVIAHELPAGLTDLEWYTDVEIFDPDETRFRGTDSSAWKYLTNLVEWSTRQKESISYEIPITTTNIALDLLNRVTFSDTVYTNATNRTGWITKIGLDLKNHKMEIELTLDPWDQTLVEDNLVIERGEGVNTDTITERDQSLGDDTITEGA